MPAFGVQPLPPANVVYPETDGAPIAENTLQFEWIAKIVNNLDALFEHDHDVFVAGDLFWYPVKGDPSAVMAPDAMVAFGRPKGHRRSYMQWDEGGVAPQVVFEVLSPSNRPAGELTRKLAFYDRFGVEEYYLFDPESAHFRVQGYLRIGARLVEIPQMDRHKSPRLQVTFEVANKSLRLIRPDGRPFVSYAALANENARLRALLREKGIEPP
ncbi:MAG: Uma2 family endonuclease [Phycisphaerae bacterium]|nr:Uma2 family endonuclease [Tepidisphaeraceae bacterium]